jgi:hypothetical protein
MGGQLKLWCPECGQSLPSPPPDDVERETDWRAVSADTKRRAYEQLAAFRRNPTRRDDPIGSRVAADEFSVVAGPYRVKAYTFLLLRGERGAILEEIANTVGCRENSISTQLSTMRSKMDLLDGPGPELRLTTRNTKQGVWRVRR